MGLKRGIEKAVDAIVEELKAQSKEVAGKEDIARVGTVVSREREIGDVIADAIEKVGKDGVVNVEEGQTFGLELEFTEGMQFDKGYLSPYMITDPERMEAELEEPYVLIANQKIGAVKDILPVLEQVIQAGRPLLIVAEDVEGESLATIVVNKLRGTFTAVARRRASVTAKDARGHRHHHRRRGHHRGDGAQAREHEALAARQGAKIVIDKDATTIIDGAGETDAIKGRIKQLKQEIENTDSDFDREKLQERLAKLPAASRSSRSVPRPRSRSRRRSTASRTRSRPPAPPSRRHRVGRRRRAPERGFERHGDEGPGPARGRGEDRRGDHLPRGRGAAPPARLQRGPRGLRRRRPGPPRRARA